MEKNYPNPSLTYPERVYEYLYIQAQKHKARIFHFLEKKDEFSLEANYNECRIDLFGWKSTAMPLTRMKVQNSNKKTERETFEELEKILLNKK